MRRREFIKRGAAAGGIVLSGAGFAGGAFANRHGHPHEASLDFLDRKTYSKDMTVHTVLKEGLRGQNAIQMYANGKQRFFFTDGDVIDITDPLHPTVINEGGWQGARPNLAYNRKLGKWILITGRGAPSTSATEDKPGGKYTYPEKIEQAKNFKGLRGAMIYDASDPMNIRLLSKWSADQGDPGRELQTGEGVTRSYYDGGKYAYLDAGPDNSFTRMESPYRYYGRCLQIIDVENPARPKFVSNWWMPGQRDGEDEAYRKWRGSGDKVSWTSSNGYCYVPKRVEDGGKYAYSTWGAFGFLIHDVSDPAHPRLVGRFRGAYKPGSIDFYNCNLSWIDQGIAIAHGETLEPDCAAPLHMPWILDVRDPADPKPLSQLPPPTPPAGAPYDDFCQKRGRYGTRNSSRLKAPGRVDRNFLAISFFNAGLQCYDFSNPREPKIVAYFIPPQGGALDRWNSYNRSVQNVFIEWDRKLIWVGTDSGFYLLSSPHLGKPVLEPMAVTAWTLPHLGAPA